MPKTVQYYKIFIAYWKSATTKKLNEANKKTKTSSRTNDNVGGNEFVERDENSLIVFVSGSFRREESLRLANFKNVKLVDFYENRALAEREKIFKLRKALKAFE